MAYLKDEEKRILFAALSREKKVCEEVDRGKVNNDNCRPLVPIVRSLERKFMYDRFERDIRNEVVDKFIKEINDACNSDENISDNERVILSAIILEVGDKLKKGE